jgi:hypothetical protein
MLPTIGEAHIVQPSILDFKNNMEYMNQTRDTVYRRRFEKQVQHEFADPCLRLLTWRTRSVTSFGFNAFRIPSAFLTWRYRASFIIRHIPFM